MPSKPPATLPAAPSFVAWRAEQFARRSACRVGGTLESRALSRAHTDVCSPAVPCAVKIHGDIGYMLREVIRKDTLVSCRLKRRGDDVHDR